MEAATGEKENILPPIPEPDLNNLDLWLKEVVDKPAETYSTATSAAGKTLEPAEQLELTRRNLSQMVTEHQGMRSHPRLSSHALSDSALKKELVTSVRESRLSTRFR